MYAMLKSWDIVGYTYRAATYCDMCITRMVPPAIGLNVPTEDALDYAAERMGIDRADEWSFDSDDFPKVIFAASVEYAEPCDACTRPLLD